MENTSIKKFLKEVYSKKPVPSAGVSLAISGATGTALIGKAILITLKKERSQELEFFNKKINSFINDFLSLGKEDMEIVLKFLRKDSDATKRAIEVPLEISEKSLEVLQQYREISKKIATQVKGDAEAGALLLKTCCKGNLMLAEENLIFLDEKNKSFYKIRIKKNFEKFKLLVPTQ